MKEYNFDENKNMGETVRIDDIKTKLDELDNRDDYDCLLYTSRCV